MKSFALWMEDQGSGGGSSQSAYKAPYKKGQRVTIFPHGKDEQKGVVQSVKGAGRNTDTSNNAQTTELMYVIKLDGGGTSTVHAGDVMAGGKEEE